MGWSLQPTCELFKSREPTSSREPLRKETDPDPEDKAAPKSHYAARIGCRMTACLALAIICG